ncbi:MAG: 16S rRNA (guanine(527)-N(7))-methyltransferase RsmG [Lachnospiraceae bacterium]|nr:16S rRNA (guanine(527)-N(7))-methyltransferase RsmG [Lachnospiraceae bacterium]
MGDINKEISYIIERFGNNGLTIDNHKAEQLYRFYSMLVEKNKVMNLTAITEFEEVVDKHFIDSAILGKYVDLNSKTVIDVGTGAGFPGIPLKILYPDIKLTLLDSLNKRIVFLNEVITGLNLSGVSAIHARAEELGVKTDHREQYDICVSRAVSNLSTLVEYCIPFVKVGGCFYSYKAAKASEEISQAGTAVKILGGKITDNIEVKINAADFERTIVGIEKISATPKKYPRGGNKPASNPIQ